MEIFVARQPILNEHKRLFAYELLYRGTDEGHVASGEKGSVLKMALGERSGPLVPFLDAAIAFERHDREACVAALDELGVDKNLVQQMYLDSLVFADALAGF